MKKNKLYLIIIIVLSVCLLGLGIYLICSANTKKEPSKTEEQTNNSNIPTNNEEEEPVDNLSYIDVDVTNINTTSDYNIKLVRNNNMKNEDGYAYAFYDATNAKMMTDFDYTNQTCGNDCSTDFGCVEQGIKLYSIQTNNKDYIYGTYKVNNCGGYDNIYFIYDIEQEKIVEADYGASDVTKTSKGSIIIDYVVSGNEDCDTNIECLNYPDDHIGYIFVNKGFNLVTGISAFQNEDNFIIVDRNKSDDYTINIYNENGKIEKTINNCVAYNDKYMVLHDGNNLILYDINNNKIGNIDSHEYNVKKYYYDRHLKAENNSITIEYFDKSDDSEKIETINYTF